jgi:hypothetical protein
MAATSTYRALLGYFYNPAFAGFVFIGIMQQALLCSFPKRRK